MSITATSAQSIKFDYLNLLVTQMRNQNPLEPMSNDQMTAQLAQLSSLEQLENINSNLAQLSELNTSFAKVLEDSQLNYARSLVGKQVSYLNGETDNIEMGYVEQIELNSEGYKLRIGNKLIDVDQITSVGTEDVAFIPNDLQYANSLVNRTIYYVDTSGETATIETGKVVDITQNNDKIYVSVNDQIIGLDQVIGIME